MVARSEGDLREVDFVLAAKAADRVGEVGGGVFDFAGRPSEADWPACELNKGNRPWGPMRMIFLEYPSDPIVFSRPPAWGLRPLGRSNREASTWRQKSAGIPVVTFVQQICDMMTATTTPRGVGHVCAAAHYLDAWIAVTEPQGWNEDSLATCANGSIHMTYKIDWPGFRKAVELAVG